MFHGTLRRAGLLAFGLLALACLASGPAAAQSQVPVTPASLSPVKPLPDTVDRYGMVFDDWAAKWQPQTAILVVRRDGQTVFMRGHNVDPRQPTMIASLSKPITGACVATLIRDRKLSFT